MSSRPKRLYLVEGTYLQRYGPNWVRRRTYQSAKAAERAAKRWLAGRDVEFGHDGSTLSEMLPPADLVTIAVSEPVVFGEPQRVLP